MCPSRNSMVLHPTQPGKTAHDSDGLDSPFVHAFLAALATPGRLLDAVVKDTKSRVAQKTDGRQVPTAYGSVSAVCCR